MHLLQAPVGAQGGAGALFSAPVDPRYEEAIAELKPKGSGGGVGSDHATSDESDQDYGTSGPPKPPPRLRIAFDSHIFAVPSASSIPTANSGSSASTAQVMSTMQQMPPLGSPGNPSTTPEKVALPPPLQRVIVRPPKAVSKAKQPKIMPQLPEGRATNRFNQSLLGIPSERNGFTELLLKAAEKNEANATPWISVQHQDVNEPMLPPVSDPRRRSGTVVAPAFSPITERFPTHGNQGPQGTEDPSHETVQSHIVHLTADESIITPGLISSPAPAAPNSVWNARSIVTETGSPVPYRKGLTSNAPSAGKGFVGNAQNGTTAAHKQTATVSVPAPQKPQTDPALANVPRRLDPITGNIIPDAPTQPESSRAASPGERAPNAPSPKEAVPPAPRDGAGEVQKAAAALTEATKEPSETTRPIIDTAAEPPKGTRRRRTPKSVMRTTEPSSQPDVGEKKRKYSKSEAQRQKESARADRRERERREKQAGSAAKVAGEDADAEAKKVEPAAAAAVGDLGD